MIEFSLVKLKKNRFFRPLKVGSNLKIFLQGKASEIFVVFCSTPKQTISSIGETSGQNKVLFGILLIPSLTHSFQGHLRLRIQSLQQQQSLQTQNVCLVQLYRGLKSPTLITIKRSRACKARTFTLEASS